MNSQINMTSSLSSAESIYIGFSSNSVEVSLHALELRYQGGTNASGSPKSYIYIDLQTGGLIVNPVIL